MRPLRLMADYQCYPLWEAGEAIGNVDPRSLDISSDLADALIAWGNEYTAMLNWEDPASSGFADEATAEAWVLAGGLLASRLRDEGIVVHYFYEGGKPAGQLVARTE